jgi:hypothetical protein
VRRGLFDRRTDVSLRSRQRFGGRLCAVGNYRSQRFRNRIRGTMIEGASVRVYRDMLTVATNSLRQMASGDGRNLADERNRARSIC